MKDPFKKCRTPNRIYIDGKPYDIPQPVKLNPPADLIPRGGGNISAFPDIPDLQGGDIPDEYSTDLNKLPLHEFK